MYVSLSLNVASFYCSMAVCICIYIYISLITPNIYLKMHLSYRERGGEKCIKLFLSLLPYALPAPVFSSLILLIIYNFLEEKIYHICISYILSKHIENINI